VAASVAALRRGRALSGRGEETARSAGLAAQTQLLRVKCFESLPRKARHGMCKRPSVPLLEEIDVPDTVADIMDPEFFHASQADSIGRLLHDMAELGLGSAPVLDDAGHPIGMATVREIDSCRRMDELTEQVLSAAVSVPRDTPITVAAKVLAERNADCLILVDGQGVAVGALRAIDLLRALLGLTRPCGPSGVPRVSRAWSHGMLLDVDSAHHAPALPGIILLDPGGANAKPNVVWVETAANIQERLDEMLRLPQDEPVLEALLSVHPRRVVFRVLVVPEGARRARMAQSLRAVLARRQAESSSPILTGAGAT
jgi:CBS domain-containing protein